MVPRTGDYRVASTPGEQIPYLVVGEDGIPVEPVREYLLELFTSDCSPLTVKSYAFDLLDWFRFLSRVGVPLGPADRRQVRDWVLDARSKAIDPIPEGRRHSDRRTQRRSPLEPRRPGPRGTYRHKQGQRIPEGHSR
jgi:hypothetical protein